MRRAAKKIGAFGGSFPNFSLIVQIETFQAFQSGTYETFESAMRRRAPPKNGGAFHQQRARQKKDKPGKIGTVFA